MVPVLQFAFKYVFFPLGHEDVSIGRSKCFAHWHAFDLKVGVKAELEVIVFEADYEKL